MNKENHLLLTFFTLIFAISSFVILTFILGSVINDVEENKISLLNEITTVGNKLNLIDQRDIQTDYDLYALAVGNNVAGNVLSNLDIPLSKGGICDDSKIPISNLHFGNKGMQIWYNEFEKGNVMTTLTNRTKIYQTGENRTAVSADEFCEMIQQK